MKQIVWILICVVVLFTGQFAQAQQKATEVIPKREKLLNGLPITILERPGSGSIAIHIVIKSGATFDLAGKAGLADLTAQMMLRNAGPWTAERLQEELGDIGARLEVTTGWDSTEIKLLGKAADIDKLMEILNLTITQTKFKEPVFQQLKAERLQAVTLPDKISGLEIFTKALYGTHPYGHNILGTTETVGRISLGDALDFYNRFYLANNASLIVSGEVQADNILPKLRRAMGGWRKGAIIPYTFAPPKGQPGLNISVVDRAEADKAEIYLGNSALKRTDSDYLATQLLINLLNQRLTTQHQYHATLAARKLAGPFFCTAIVSNANTNDAITSMINESKRLATGIEEAELQQAKQQLISDFQNNINTNTELAARWAEAENYNFGLNYIRGYNELVNAVSIDAVKMVANKYLTLDSLTVVVLGKASEIAPNLQKLGKVELIHLQAAEPEKAKVK